MSATHLAALRLLKGQVYGDADEAYLAMEADWFDAWRAVVQQIEQDIFPDTTSDLASWERVLDLDGSGTDDERRAAILAKLRAVGGMSKAFFLALATEMGYEIEIATCPYPFRAGVSAAGDAVIDVNPDGLDDPPDWDETSMGPYCPALFTWTVTVLDFGSNDDSTALQEAFEALKPGFTTIVWEVSTVMSKSKTITIQTPAAGDEVALLYAVEAATLQTIHAAVVGGTSVSLEVFQASSLGSGTSGAACCAETSIAPSDGAKAITPTVTAVAAGQFVYVVVTAVSGSPTSVSLFLSYTGGD
jgi:Bacteriophage Mu-like, Gp48